MDRLRLLSCAAASIVVTDRSCVLRKARFLLDEELLLLGERVEAARKQGQLDYVLRRAAMLHADVAMSSGSELFDSGSTQLVGAVRRLTIGEDGRNTATYFGAIHWDIARSLLDVVRPAGDPMVLLWYQATATWMQANAYHEDTDHLVQGVRLFPKDATLLPLSGCEHELFAPPSIQAATRSIVLPPGYELAVKSDETELRDAEALFRRALAQQPEHLEARLRLGRVLLMRGRVT
jgi:hypothetical protein